jgi:DMSO/TMAO reductase YedYZ heme-binding membrane subunit
MGFTWDLSMTNPSAIICSPIDLLEGNVVKKKTRIWYLALVAVGTLIIAGVLLSLDPLQATETALSWVVRGAALLGYQFVFLAIISSAFMRPLIKFFGRSFVNIHHVLSITGLVLITLHPVTAAINAASLAVFVPRFASWRLFLSLGGRPAWYLIGVAALAAALRKPIGKRWRLIHYLNYVAFWLASIHASLIGTTFVGAGPRYIILKVIIGILAAATVTTLIQKRWVAYKRRKARG